MMNAKPATNGRGQIKKSASTNRAVIKHKAQRVMGPEFWGAESTWDSLGAVMCMGVLLCPLKNDIQALVARFGRYPDIFSRKLEKLINQQRRKATKDPMQRDYVAWGDEFSQRIHGASRNRLSKSGKMTETKNGSLFSNLPQHWEDRQFRELDNLMELVRMMLTREFPTGLDSKRVFEGIGTLLAGPVGRRKEEKYRAGLAILRSGKHSKKSVFHEICKDLDPGYKILTLDETTLTAEEKKKRKDDRDRRRKAMKAGIRREAKRQGVNWPILPQGYETPANS